jgi:uncharacterized RDD family membrane protein YckC
MICSKCNANSPTSSPFCRNCGFPLVGYSLSAISGGAAAAVLPAVAMEEEGTGTYAGFWLRFVAALIDAAVFLGATVFLVLLAVAFTRGGVHSSGRSPVQTISEFAFIFRIVSAIIIWLYFALMESSSWQATLGKRAMGIYVTDMDGRRISFGRASGRHFAKFISNLTVFVGYIIAGFSEKKQALHDMIASCLVQRRTQA